MKRSLAVFLAAGALICSSVAFAAPKALSSAQLDSISAGSSITDMLLPTTAATVNATNNEASDKTSTATASDNGVAASGQDSEVNQLDQSGNIAVAGGDAVAGNGSGNETDTKTTNDGNTGQIATGDDGHNLAGSNQKQQNVKQDADNALNAGDNANIQVREIKDTSDGSAAIAGDNNTTTVTTDKSKIEGKIENDSAGVIAREATVTNSFNTQVTENDIHVELKDSYNVTTNTLDISGQGTVTAIVNANTLGEQNIGVNVNVTNSAATVPSGEVGNGQTPTSEADTHQVQVNIVNSFIGVQLGLLSGATP